MVRRYWQESSKQQTGSPCWSRMPSSVTFWVSDEGVRYQQVGGICLIGLTAPEADQLL